MFKPSSSLKGSFMGTTEGLNINNPTNCPNLNKIIFLLLLYYLSLRFEVWVSCNHCNDLFKMKGSLAVDG